MCDVREHQQTLFPLAGYASISDVEGCLLYLQILLMMYEREHIQYRFTTRLRRGVRISVQSAPRRARAMPSLFWAYHLTQHWKDIGSQVSHNILFCSIVGLFSRGAASS